MSLTEHDPGYTVWFPGNSVAHPRRKLPVRSGVYQTSGYPDPYFTLYRWFSAEHGSWSEAGFTAEDAFEKRLMRARCGPNYWRGLLK